MIIKLSPGDTWDLLTEQCPACGASPVTVTSEGGDDYLVDCDPCKYKIRIESEDGEEGLVSDVLHASTHCACGFELADAAS